MEEKHKLPVSAKIIVKQVDGEPYIYLKPIYDDEKETPPTVEASEGFGNYFSGTYAKN